MISVFALYRWGGLGLTVLGLPLIFRLIPQNPIFGARLPQAFAAPGNWYAINAYTGKLLSAFGLMLFASSFPLAHFLATVARSSRALMLLLPVLALSAIVRRVRRFAQQFDGPLHPT